MQFEVENKFPVDDLAVAAEQLGAWGRNSTRPSTRSTSTLPTRSATSPRPTRHSRIRRVGNANLVTYKGPKIDQATKTRREIELPLATGGECVEQYRELLEALGFRVVAEVKKRRRCGRFCWDRWPVHVALDEVEHVGRFVELEIQAEADVLKEAQASLVEVATRLGFSQVERRSYLEMLLDGR